MGLAEEDEEDSDVLCGWRAVAPARAVDLELHSSTERLDPFTKVEDTGSPETCGLFKLCSSLLIRVRGGPGSPREPGEGEDT